MCSSGLLVSWLISRFDGGEGEGEIHLFASVNINFCTIFFSIVCHLCSCPVAILFVRVIGWAMSVINGEERDGGGGRGEGDR